MKTPMTVFAAATCAATVISLSAVVSAAAVETPSHSSEPGIAALERDFHELPLAARRQTGPLFWLHGDDSEANAGSVCRQGRRRRQRVFHD